MAKNSIRDYSATNSSNTDIQSIDISEGCSPAGINNAIREVMADLKDVSTGAVALESPAFDSASLTGDLTFGDNDKAVFGAGSDLQIYHNGTKSIISDVGTGVLRLAGTDFDIMNTAQTKRYMLATDGGAVTLYYDNSAKFATTATGVDVTGTGTMDRLGLGSAAHASAALLLTTTNQHIRMDNGGELGVIELDSDGKINIWAHGDGETINLKTGSGAGIDVLSVVGSNVGIGTSSPTSNRQLTLYGNDAGLQITGSAAGSNAYLTSTPGSSANFYFGTTSAKPIIFVTNGENAERMRIDSSGNLLLGTASAISSGFYSSSFNGATQNGIVLKTTLASNGTDFIRFINSSGSVIGEIEQNSASTVAYLTSSDYRLKTAVTYDWDATSRLKQLRPARFEWIADGDDAVPVDGFLAHEVQDVVPEAISGTKDAMMDEEYEVSAATGDIYTPAIEAVLDEDGNEVTPAVAEVIHSTDVEQPEELAEGQQWRETTAAVMGTRSVPDYQGIDQSKLVPLLVKTIQELEARITALEAN